MGVSVFSKTEHCSPVENTLQYTVYFSPSAHHNLWVHLLVEDFFFLLHLCLYSA